MNIQFRMEGGAELDRALSELSMRVSRSVQLDALTQGAEPIRATASAHAPVEPGAPDLKANIIIATKHGGYEGHPAVGVGVPKGRGFARYDLKQEFGTVRHGAQPFYRPAMDAQGQASINKIRQVLWSALISKGAVTSRGSGGGVGL